MILNQFKTPWILFIIPVVVPALFYLLIKRKPASMRFPSASLVSFLPPTWKTRFIKTPKYIRIIAISLFIIALAGPRSVLKETIHKTEGIDIVLAVDSSGSMAAEDFKINKQRLNRLEIVKNVVAEFIGKRKNDKIGLVAFAGLAYTICPLTTDYSWLSENLKRVELRMIKDGTAVGSAIMSSVDRLKTSKAKSKIMILLTDGMNNAGEIDPISAARVAKAFDITIYTIGAGSKGYVPYPVTDMFDRTIYQNVIIDLDEETLKQVADITNGQYFNASDTESLRMIYEEIDQLEKTEIEEFGYREYKELFGWFVLATVLLLFLEILLSHTVLMRIP